MAPGYFPSYGDFIHFSLSLSNFNYLLETQVLQNKLAIFWSNFARQTAGPATQPSLTKCLIMIDENNFRKTAFLVIIISTQAQSDAAVVLDILW